MRQGMEHGTTPAPAYRQNPVIADGPMSAAEHLDRLQHAGLSEQACSGLRELLVDEQRRRAENPVLWRGRRACPMYRLGARHLY